MSNPRLSFFRLIFFSGVSMLILLLYLIQHIYVMNINFKIQKISRELAVLQNENEKLQVALAKDTSLENIDTIAVNKLGMIRPLKVEYILVSDLNTRNKK